MKLALMIIALVLVGAFVFTGCGQGNKKEGENMPKINAKEWILSPEQGKKMMEENKSIQLIDVRTVAEYQEGHIAGAKNFPLDQVVSKVSAAYPDKTTPIIVYCRSGRRSEEAAKELRKAGYTTVYDMGGIMAWPYEIVK